MLVRYRRNEDAMRASLSVVVLLVLAAAGPCHALGCSPLGGLPTGIVAPAEELQPQLAKPACLFADDLGRRLSAAVAAAPMLPVATASTSPVAHSAPTNVSAGGYVPKTKDDNTPWRFDMNQNGRRMTAEEFDAWMKAKGIHVATGQPAATQTSTNDCKPTTTIAC